MRPKLVSPNLFDSQLLKNELPEIKPPKVRLPCFMPHGSKTRITYLSWDGLLNLGRCQSPLLTLRRWP